MALAVHTGVPMSEWAADPAAVWTAARLLKWTGQTEEVDAWMGSSSMDP